jgi:type II secretory pathway pseudopilin PulG
VDPGGVTTVRILRRLRSRFAQCAGTSLIELAVTMGLMSLVGALVMSSLSTSARANAQVDDQHRGLADLQVVTERMSRDLRIARGVDPLATTSQLTLWIDSDSDYRRDTNESVTWRIECRTGVDCDTVDKQYDVERVVGPIATGVVQIVGQSLVSDIAFGYIADGVLIDPATATTGTWASVTKVQVAMEYDAIVDQFARSNSVDFEVRLRNVE